MSDDRATPADKHLPDRGAPRSALGTLFDVATRYHQAGRFAEAEHVYRQILAQDPHHADSLHLLGVLSSQTGRHAAAIALIGQAIQIRGGVSDYHVNLGNAFQGNGDPAQAIVHYQRALTLKPDVALVHYNLAGALKAMNRLDEAVAHYRRAIALRPDAAQIHNNLGNTLKDQGKFDEAIVHYDRALALLPAYAEVHNNLGNALKAQGRLAEAVAQYERALTLRPDYAEALNNLGSALKAQGDIAGAMDRYRQALAVRPDSPEVHNNLGNLLHEQGRPADAVSYLERAAALKPGYGEAHANLGNAFKSLGRISEAIAQYERAIALRPDFGEACYNLGNTLEAEGRLDDAVVQYRRAIALRPDVAEIHHNLGNVLRDQGLLADAEACYAKAIELAPRNAVYYRHLIDMRHVGAGDRHLAAIEELVRDIPALPPADRKELHFALGKAYADQGDHERAFRHLLQANALKRREIVYDEAEALRAFDRTIAVFSRELMHDKAGHGDPSPVPIFIIGMPRSGTTLVEQILASHPMVFGGGERRDFDRCVVSPDPATIYPEAVPSLSGAVLRQRGGAYIAAINAAAPKVSAAGDAAPGGEVPGAAAAVTRITDKMPGNFNFAGLIHLALPNARIIHMRRDPIDTCTSCFALHFGAGQPYSYDLRELGRYYRGYERLMAHWRFVLPEGVMLDVSYEDLVADLETQARRIVVHCGLGWDSACLAFYQTQRTVRTASGIQVRQPIYHHSVGRWRRYGPLSQPLIEELSCNY